MGDPVAKLGELRERMKLVESEISERTKEKDTLKADVTELEKVVQDVNQISNAYGQALKSIEKDKNDIEAYLTMKSPMIEAAIGDKKDQADKIIHDWETKLQKQKDTVEKAKTALDKATSEYESAKSAWEGKKQAYESLKGFQKGIEEKVKDLKYLKDQIESKETENKIADMYFLGQESQNVLKELKTEVKTQEEFKAEITKSWQERDEADTALREKEKALKAAKDPFDGENKVLEAMEKDRRKLILEGLSKLPIN